MADVLPRPTRYGASRIARADDQADRARAAAWVHDRVIRALEEDGGRPLAGGRLEVLPHLVPAEGPQDEDGTPVEAIDPDHVVYRAKVRAVVEVPRG